MKFKRILVLTVVGVLSPLVPALADGNIFLSNFVDKLNASMPPNLDSRALSELWHIDGVQNHPMGGSAGAESQDRKAIEAFFSGFDERWQSWVHTEQRRVVDGNVAFWQGTAGGIRNDSGKQVEVPFAFLVEFDDDGLILQNDVYINIDQIRQQLE